MKNSIKILLLICLIANGALAQSVIKIPENLGVARKGFKTGMIADSKLNLYISYYLSSTSNAFRGLGVYNYQDSSWLNLDTSNSIFLSPKINNISLQNDTLLWISTDSGLYNLRNLNTLTAFQNNQINIGSKIKRVYAKGSNVVFISDSGIFKFANNTLSKFPQTSFLPKNFELLNDGSIIFNDSLGLYILSSAGCDTIKEDYLGNKIPFYLMIKQVTSGEVWLFSYGKLDKLNNGKICPNDVCNYLYPNFIQNFTSDQINLSNDGFGSVSNCYNGVQIYRSNFNDPNYLFASFFNDELNFYLQNPKYQNKGTYSVLTTTNDSLLVMARGNLFTISAPKDTVFILSLDNFEFLKTSQYVNYEMQTLNINNVSAVANIGDLSWNLSDPRYEVPKGSKKNTIFASALWLGALDQNDQLHVAVQTYRQTGIDFFSGPLDLNTANITELQALDYKRIWKVEAWQIQEFIANFQNGNVQNGSYTPAEVILTWPGNGTGNKAATLAEFVDVNNDGLYRPLQDGDYPKIYGDQCLFWIMNDQLYHTETSGNPLGVELHCYAYAYYCPDKENTPDRALNYTTFYKYKIHNRTTNNYHDMYYGPWHDDDLGNYDDDYVGCYPVSNSAFTYNGDSIEEGNWGYGNYPPVQGTLFLNGPLANNNDGNDNDNDGTIDEVNEKCLLNNFTYYNNDFSEIGNPEIGIHYYNYMRSIWKDSTHKVNNGVDGWINGGGAGPETNFMFDALPYQTGWHETAGLGDRRYLSSGGPFNLNAGQVVEVDYAYVTSFDSVNTYNSQAYWQTYLNDLDVVRNHFNNSNGEACYFKTSLNEVSKRGLMFEVYPNPNSGIFEIKSNIKDIIEVYAMDGKVLRKININAGINQVKLDQLSVGIYLLKSTQNNKGLKVVIE